MGTKYIPAWKKEIDEALAPKRDLTWLEPRGQQERCDMLNRLDAALSGADQMAGALGQTTLDYAECLRRLRGNIQAERQKLLAELEAAG